MAGRGLVQIVTMKKGAQRNELQQLPRYLREVVERHNSMIDA